MPKIIIERDFQMTIRSILGKSQAPKQIRNLLEDTNIHINGLKNVKFLHSNRTVNELADDKRAKKARYCNSLNININRFS